MPNRNYLTGLCCPKCGALAPFKMAVKCMALVTDDGVQETYNHSWDGKDLCICADLECGFEGKVKDFEPKRKTSGNKNGRPK